MEQDKNEEHRFGGSRNPRIWSGIVLLIAGCLLLANKMGAPVPFWIFTWPVLLIAIGILSGIRSQFHNPGAFIIIMIGSIFLIDQTNPELNFHNYILPIILIGVGLIYIFRPKTFCRNRYGRRWRQNSDWSSSQAIPVMKAGDGTGSTAQHDAEFVEINAVFGSVKKIVLSKNFRGGEINCFMGGSEINLMQSDLQHPVRLEVNNIFGGTKLIVPSNWNVKNEVMAIFGGIEDKRNALSTPDPGKTLTLAGTCVFGGIEIINY